MSDRSIFQTIFQKEDGAWIQPTVSGGSAGLNSAMFFVCPTCGVCVLDMNYEHLNRIRHNEWHKSQIPDTKIKLEDIYYDLRSTLELAINRYGLTGVRNTLDYIILHQQKDKQV